jgi:hypothetical protein
MAGDCIFRNLSDCGDYQWTHKTTYKELVSLEKLDNDISPHFVSLHLSTEESGNISERFLVNNRAGKCGPGPDNALVCPKHRFSLGIRWRPKQVCQHPNHTHTKHKKKAVRSVSVSMAKYISDKYKLIFPIGGSMCAKCRLEEGESMKSKKMPPEASQNIPAEGSSEMEEDLPLAMLQDDPVEKSSESEEDVSAVQWKLTKLNEEMGTKGITPVKYAGQSYLTGQSLEKVTPRTVQSLKRKYTQFIQGQTRTFIEATCPGQETLFNETVMKPVLVSLSQDNVECISIEQDHLMNELITAYNDSTDKVSKLQILSLVPERYSKTTVMILFGCTKYQAERCRKMRQVVGAHAPILTYADIHRNRLPKNKVLHFLEFLHVSNLLHDTPLHSKDLQLSTGKTVEVPQMVLTITKQHAILLYLDHCTHNDYSPLSASSLRRVLDESKATQRKALQGLDNYVVRGSNALDNIKSLVEDVFEKFPEVIDGNEELASNTEKIRRFIKNEYQSHASGISDDPVTSNDVHHCRKFALSDEKEAKFSSKCEHETHSVSCLKCGQVDEFFQAVRDLVEGINAPEEKEEKFVILQDAEQDIKEWIRHILRGVQQNVGKTEMFQELLQNGETIILLSDWAMKFLPLKYRETMSEWFGKRGMSLHIDVIFVTDQESNEELLLENIKKVTYITIVEKTKQDMFSVLCVFDHLLAQVKMDFPDKKFLLHRSDNAGCYSGTAVIFGKQKICEKYKIELKQILFCEPQRGKDQADRDSAVIKHRLNSYVDAGQDAEKPEQLFAGILWNNGLKNMKPCVIEIKPELGKLNVQATEGITNCHNIKFFANGIKTWRYFEIGSGKDIPMKELEMDLTYTVVKKFPDEFPIGFAGLSRKEPGSSVSEVQEKTILECPEENCVCTFEKNRCTEYTSACTTTLH